MSQGHNEMGVANGEAIVRRWLSDRESDEDTGFADLAETSSIGGQPLDSLLEEEIDEIFQEALETIVSRGPAGVRAAASRACFSSGHLLARRVAGLVPDALRGRHHFSESDREQLSAASRLARRVLGDRTPRRDRIVQVRLSADEQRELRARADEAAMSVSEYVRSRALSIA